MAPDGEAALVQFADAPEGSATDALASDLGKLAFDLVEPRGPGRSAEVIPRPVSQPVRYLRVFVCSVIIEDQMDF